MSKLYIIPLCFFLILLNFPVSAQNFYKEKTSRDNIFSIGVGPSFAYLDNGGPYRTFEFEIKPSITLSLIKRVTPRFDLRASAGTQWLATSNNAGPNVQGAWFENNAAFTAKGNVYYLDIMPSANLIAFGNHMNRSLFNLYGGLGLGILHSTTEQTKTYDADAIIYNEQVTTGYVPVRAGLSFTLGPYSDLAAEGTMLFTFTDKLDGNENFNKYGDHMAQLQLVYRRYFFPKNEK